LKLKDISSIRSGLLLSRKKSDDRSNANKYPLITLKSVDDSGVLNKELLDEFYTLEEISNEYLTSENDIIVRLREPVFACSIEKENESLLIPSYFAKLSMNEKYSKKFLSKYVAHYINSKNAQKEFKKDTEGSVISMIKLKAIENLEIPEIPIEKQEKIIKIAEFKQKELKLLKELTILKEKYYSKILEDII
jgi:restriction endonuclease S subunit